MDNQQANYNAWTGNRQGLFVQNSTAYFDLYIYRDAYTPIMAVCPANQNGTNGIVQSPNVFVLDNIHNNDWALYAGVEFGNAEYSNISDSLKITACSATTGGTVEVWLDSIDTGNKIAVCNISNTGAWSIFKTFTTNVSSPVTGSHDVYLKFIGTGTDRLFKLQWIYFTSKNNITSVAKPSDSAIPLNYRLEQNYPNPFNPSTTINFTLAKSSVVKLSVYNLLGQKVAALINGNMNEGQKSVLFDASKLSSGFYIYSLEAGSFKAQKKMLLLK